MQKGRNWMQGDFYKGEDLGASYNKNNTAFLKKGYSHTTL